MWPFLKNTEYLGSGCHSIIPGHPPLFGWCLLSLNFFYFLLLTTSHGILIWFPMSIQKPSSLLRIKGGLILVLQSASHRSIDPNLVLFTKPRTQEIFFSNLWEWTLHSQHLGVSGKAQHFHRHADSSRIKKIIKKKKGKRLHTRKRSGEMTIRFEWTGIKSWKCK